MIEKDLFIPRIPEVDIRPDIGAIFSRARKNAKIIQIGEDGSSLRQIIIITPGRLLIAKMCPHLDTIPDDQVAVLNELVPPEPKKNIAVIAYTYLEALKRDIRRAIPFVDFLMGFAAIGHKVWIFEGHNSAISAGCREADFLLVDGGLLPSLEEHEPEWRQLAMRDMRGDKVRIIARSEEKSM